MERYESRTERRDADRLGYQPPSISHSFTRFFIIIDLTKQTHTNSRLLLSTETVRSSLRLAVTEAKLVISCRCIPQQPKVVNWFLCQNIHHKFSMSFAENLYAKVNGWKLQNFVCLLGV